MAEHSTGHDAGHRDAGHEERQPLAIPVTERNWTVRIVLFLVLVAVAALAAVFSITVIPRWWSHRVGDLIAGSITRGVLYGLLTGFLFTLAPLVVVRQVFRSIPWRLRLLVLVLALVLAAPNLMTLGIVLGNGNAAHAGDRVLDVEAPAFRTAEAWGAAVAVVVAAVLVVWVWKWRRDRRAASQQPAV